MRSSTEQLAGLLASNRIIAAPRSAALAALAADARSGADCHQLALELTSELGRPIPRDQIGWGGYGARLGDWQRLHRTDDRHPGGYRPRRTDGIDAFQVSGTGRVLTLVEHFSPAVTAPLALASIVHSLLPGKVRLVYALKATQCQQAIYLGGGLGSLLGSSGLGAFVELSSGRGVGHTLYDATRVNRARITPLGRIGGQPCT